MDGVTSNPPNGNDVLKEFLQDKSAREILSNFFVEPNSEDPSGRLNDAAIIAIDTEWWQKHPNPMTELGISELQNKFILPNIYANNILTGVQTVHARLKPYAHLHNDFPGAGDPEKFELGTTKFVTEEEARQVLVDTFVRPHELDPTNLQPIILVGHAVENEFEHILEAFGVDLLSYGTIVKVIDTQVMAEEAGIRGPRGPLISLKNLLSHFNLTVPNLHSAGNDAAATLMAAVLITLKENLYPGVGTNKPPAVVDNINIQWIVSALLTENKTPAPLWGVELFCTRCERENHLRANCFAKLQCEICKCSGVKRLYNASRTHAAGRCMFKYWALPPRDVGMHP
ncbi:hypothetical protein PTNB73_09012 [Pyrenophora teres f. teres]|nr:hypothetical protein PTNB85_08611 [Pyrenophora teres f. teres]KAE8857764.1 hypothetical protein PTNB73_09012 [Pyrenophora teres f. teres]